jgi:hypothetical protein
MVIKLLQVRLRRLDVRHTPECAQEADIRPAAMPGMFWGEAVATAVYLLNRAPTKAVNGMTPYEVSLMVTQSVQSWWTCSM